MKRKRGVSLLECSCILIVAAIASASYLGTQLVKIEKQKITKTQEKMTKIDEALKAHVFFVGRLPCPAKMVAVTHAKFGKESNCKNDRESNVEDLTATNNESRAGYLPVESLGLPVEYSYDGWGNFIKYVVYKPLAQENEFQAASPSVKRMKIQDKSSTINDTGYILISTGKDGYGAKKWPDNTLTTNECNASEINAAQSNNNIGNAIFNNCSLSKDNISVDSKLGQYIKWETLSKLLSIKQNWNLNRENPIINTDHIILQTISDEDVEQLKPGKYIIKKDAISNDKLRELSIDITMINEYYLMELHRNFTDNLYGKIVKNDFQEHDIVFRKNEGYFVINDSNEWIFLNNTLMQNDEILPSVDRIMNTDFITNDGIYLLQKDVADLTTSVSLESLHASCKIWAQGDMIKIKDKKCFFINNLESTAQQMIYVKDGMKFLQFNTSADNTKEWKKKYEVKEISA